MHERIRNEIQDRDIHRQGYCMVSTRFSLPNYSIENEGTDEWDVVM